MRYIATLVACVVWDTLIFGATGYLVFFRGESGWWLLLAWVVSWMPSQRDKEDKPSA